MPPNKPSYQAKLKPVSTSTPSYQSKLKPIAPPPPPPKPTLGQQIVGRYKQGVGGAVEEAKNMATGKTSPLVGFPRMILRGAGAAGNALGDVIGAGISALVPDDIEKKVDDTVAPIMKPIKDAYSLLEEKNPTLARDTTDALGATELLGGGFITRPLKRPLATAFKEATQNATEASARGADNFINNQVTNLLEQNRNITTKVQTLKDQNVDLAGILSEPDVFRGLKVEKGTIVPDEAVDALDTRIDGMMTAKRTLLPVMDRELPKISKEEVRRRAIENAKGKESPADEKEIIDAIERQVDALPDELTYSQLDDFRARFRQSSRTAKGTQKRANEYAALENATRDIVFDGSELLPAPLKTDFVGLNNDIRQNIATREFLDETLRGQKVKGGRLGVMTGRVIGGIAGSQFGWLGTLVSQEAGAAIARILVNNSLGSSFRMSLIRNLTDNPEVLRRSDEILKNVGDYKQPALPAPAPGAPRSTIPSQSTIPLLQQGDTNLRTTFPKD